MGCCNHYHEFELDFFLKKFKELIESWEKAELSFEELKKYVNEFFSKLDLQEEVNAVLNKMLSEGRLVMPYYSSLLEKPLQDSIDNLPDESVLIIDSELETDIVIKHPITIRSMNTSIKKKIIIDSNNVNVVNAVFDGGYISIKNCRGSLISGNEFRNTDKAIYVEPISSAGLGSSENDDKLFHHVAMLNITSNKFYNVKYAVYMDYYTGEDDPVDKAIRWMRINDCNITNNFINTATVTAFFVKGIDGIKICDNVVFVKSKEPTSENNIYIGKVNYAVIEGNSLFESGLDSIKVDCMLGGVIANNVFGIIGEREYSSAINIPTNVQDYGYLSITGNTFKKCSGDYIVIKMPNLGVSVSGNTVEPGNNNLFPQPIKEDKVFCNIESYNHNVSANACDLPNKLYLMPNTYDYNNKLTLYTGKKQFSKSQTHTLFNLNNTKLNGILIITASNSEPKRNIKYSTTILAISLPFKNNETSGDIDYLKEIAKTGLISKSGTGGDSTWCNFNYSVDNSNNLKAEAFSKTEGEFSFVVNFIGYSTSMDI